MLQSNLFKLVNCGIKYSMNYIQNVNSTCEMYLQEKRACK